MKISAAIVIAAVAAFANTASAGLFQKKDKIVYANIPIVTSVGSSITYEMCAQNFKFVATMRYVTIDLLPAEGSATRDEADQQQALQTIDGGEIHWRRSPKKRQGGYCLDVIMPLNFLPKQDTKVRMRLTIYDFNTRTKKYEVMTKYNPSPAFEVYTFNHFAQGDTEVNFLNWLRKPQNQQQQQQEQGQGQEMARIPSDITDPITPTGQQVGSNDGIELGGQSNLFRSGAPEVYV